MSYQKMLILLRYLIKELCKNEKYLNDNTSNNYKICHEVCKNFIDRLNIPIKVTGVDNVPKYENAIIVSNHKCFFDIILLVGLIEKEIPFASAKELMKYPILKKYIESINCVQIDRETTDLNKMREQLVDLDNTINSRGIILFPEGECSYKSDKIKEFKKGGFLAASKQDTIIVPTYINYKGIKNIGKWYIPTDEVDVIFGDMFTPSDIDTKRVKAETLANYARDRVLDLKKVYSKK